jgi:hypothetical protein
VSDAQKLASEIHRLDALARIHIGPTASAGFRGGDDGFVVWNLGKEVARGTYQEVIDKLTGGEAK